MPPRHLLEGYSAVAGNLLGQTIRNEDRYMEQIHKNHSSVKALAGQLQTMQEQLPKLLDGIIPQEELDAFFEEKRAAIKQLAEQNVQRHHNVRDFISAIKTVKQNTDQDKYTPDTDYKDVIQSTLEATKKETMDVDLPQEKFYRDVQDALGELNNDGDDVSIVVGGGTATVGLKCPITGQFMDDPVRNKLCHHAYSRHGILSHMHTKGRNCRCPVAGCVNQQPMTEDVLEDDFETQQAVRREKRRQDHEAQRMATQANDLVDSDDDE